MSFPSTGHRSGPRKEGVGAVHRETDGLRHYGKHLASSGLGSLLDVGGTPFFLRVFISSPWWMRCDRPRSEGPLSRLPRPPAVPFPRARPEPLRVLLPLVSPSSRTNLSLPLVSRRRNVTLRTDPRVHSLVPGGDRVWAVCSARRGSRGPPSTTRENQSGCAWFRWSRSKWFARGSLLVTSGCLISWKTRVSSQVILIPRSESLVWRVPGGRS